MLHALDRPVSAFQIFPPVFILACVSALVVPAMPTERKPDQVEGREASPGAQDKAGIKSKIVNFRKATKDEQEKKVSRFD